MNDDQLLADLLEGVLPKEEKERLEERLELEPELRAHFHELKALFGERAELIEYPVPSGLCDATMAVLEIEGLVSGRELKLPQELPSGLVAATMARLEDEGLVDASSAQTRSRLSVTIGILVLLLASFLGGLWLRPMLISGGDKEAPIVNPAPATNESDELKSLRLEVKVLKEKLLNFNQQKDGEGQAEKTEIIALKQSNALLKEKIATVIQARDQLVKSNLKLKQRLSEIMADRETTRQALLVARNSVSESEQTNKSLLAKLSSRESVLNRLANREAALKKELESVRLSLAREKGENQRTQESFLALRRRFNETKQQSATAFMVVKDAQHLDYWDGRWKSVVNGVKLAPGTLMRAESSRSLLRFEQRSLRLVAGYFQVTGSNKLIAVPMNSAAPDDNIVASNQGQTKPGANRDERLDPIQGIFNRLRN